MTALLVFLLVLLDLCLLLAAFLVGEHIGWRRATYWPKKGKTVQFPHFQDLYDSYREMHAEAAEDFKKRIEEIKSKYADAETHYAKHDSLSTL